MNTLHNKSCWQITCSEWKYWFFGAIFSFFLASIILSGWPAGLIPNVDYPYIFSNDGLSHGWLVERVREGWAFDNPRSGYPFGSNFLDYPGSDQGNYLVIKIISLFAGSYAATFNMFILLSFAVTFAVSYCVCRAIALSIPFSLAAALLFSFLPFHFQRLDHLFYLWYFVVPLFFYIAFAVSPLKWRQKLLWALGLVFISSFGVYYALFGLIVITVAALAMMVREGTFQHWRFPLFLGAAVIIGVLLNVAPNLVYKYEHGPNPEEVAKRAPLESELFAFRFVQLLLPMQEHRIPVLGKIANRYSFSTQFINENLNENRRSNLGLIGSAGLVLLLGVVFASLSGREMDKKLRLLALITLILFMFGTVGGFGSIFAFIISPAIRAWNRISIFINFAALLGFFMIIQMECEKRFKNMKYLIASIAIALGATVIGLYDQTPAFCESCNEQTKKTFNDSKYFVQAIEASLPGGSAIYQLPYMYFPEGPRKHDLLGYHFLEGFINSKNLLWSYGGMRGREGDLFFRTLSEKPMREQLKVIREMGFKGIYIEKRGYADHGKEIIHELTTLLGAPPALTRADDEVVFFRLEN